MKIREMEGKTRPTAAKKAAIEQLIRALAAKHGVAYEDVYKVGPVLAKRTAAKG